MTLERSALFWTIICTGYLIVAYNSSGYYHWDEHYQIIEFANYKLGNSSAHDLAWEYTSAIRPSLQPGICYVIFKLFNIIGVTDPFVLALVLRLLTAALAILIIRIFINNTKSLINDRLTPLFVALSYMLWFLPFINVRYASETWSGLFFLLAAGLIQSGYYKRTMGSLLTVSFILGLSILFKYQCALLVVGVIFWLLFVDKQDIRKIVILTAVILLVLAFGFLTDRWMYGKFVFTIYNYFYINLIEGVASNYGTAPWYQIIFYILMEPGPIGLIILIAFGLVITCKPENLIIWSVTPYILAHMLIPHKELRFLFPLVNLVPFIIIYGYQQYNSVPMKPKHWIWTITLAILIFNNLTGLMIIASKGAGKAKIAIPEYISTHYKQRPVNLLYTNGANPYQEWDSPKNTFYLHKQMTPTPLETIWQTEFSSLLKEGYVNLLVVPATEMTGPETYQYLREKGFSPVYQNIPWIVQQINGWYDRNSNNDVITLFEYDDPGKD